MGLLQTIDDEKEKDLESCYQVKCLICGCDDQVTIWSPDGKSSTKLCSDEMAIGVDEVFNVFGGAADVPLTVVRNNIRERHRMLGVQRGCTGRPVCQQD